MTADGVLDGADDKRVANGNSEDHEQGADAETIRAEKDDERCSDDDKREPVDAASAKDGHEPIEEGIAQVAINVMEQGGIEVQQPMHFGEGSGKLGSGKLANDLTRMNPNWHE